MTISDAGFVASGLILSTAIVDGVRGRTGLGRLRLSKRLSPERFWMAVALYFNMALLLFWVSGQALAPPVPEPVPVSEQPTMTIDIEKATRR